MLLMKMESGEIETFSEFEFIKGNYLALYGEKNSYLVDSANIQLKLEEGGCCEKAPVLYDTVHGKLTSDMLKKYGVSVSALCEGEKRDVQYMADTLRIVRRYTEPDRE